MKKYILLLLSCIVISGCDDDDKEKTLSESEISALVECTNLAEGYPCTRNVYGSWGYLISDDYREFCSSQFCFADGSASPEYPALTRFRDTGELIPVYYLDAKDPRFEYALNKAEEIIGYQIFDRKGIVSLEIERDDPFFEIDYSDMPTDWGFIWSQGTVLGSCSAGTVSNAPYSNSLASYAVGNDYGIDKTKWNGGYAWISIDSESPADPGCTTIASNDVSLHELAHALGMSNHFDGFGNGPAFDKNAERVLRTMYSKQNPAGQPFDSLNIEP
ncbi:hypothetical protein [Vibrio splendidus]|uniref:hypothetical protein n=4 Tax=Vibrio TaxID=662 RepID=UPI0002FA40EB|nr:hypothetical protein [Vibrio splendidus]PMK06281.1 hypothetical protein BCU08_17185 [Vibrio splendidus]